MQQHAHSGADHMGHHISLKEAPQDPLLEDDDPDDDEGSGQPEAHALSRLYSDEPASRRHQALDTAKQLLSRHWKNALLAYVAIHIFVAAAMDWHRAQTPALLALVCLVFHAAGKARGYAATHSALASLCVSEEWRARGRKGAAGTLAGIFAICVVVNVSGGLHRVLPLLGLGVAVLISYGMSKDRARVSWRTVGVGILLQYSFAVIIIQTEVATHRSDPAEAYFVSFPPPLGRFVSSSLPAAILKICAPLPPRSASGSSPRSAGASPSSCHTLTSAAILSLLTVWQAAWSLHSGCCQP